MNKEQRRKIREHHNPNGRPVIVELENAGYATCSEWYGETLAGDTIHITYHKPYLKMGIDENQFFDPKHGRIYFRKRLDTSDIYLTDEQMKKHLKNLLNFNV